MNETTQEITFNSLPAYNILLWNPSFEESNLTIIDLQYDQSIFNFCDLSQYTPEGVLPLMETYYNITQDDIDSGLQWVALFYIYPECHSLDIIHNFLEAYILAWDDLLSLYIQRTGAVGFIETYYYKYVPTPYMHVEHVDKSNGLVLGERVDKVFGVGLNPNDVITLYDAIASFSAWNETFYILTITPTPNVMDAFYRHLTIEQATNSSISGGDNDEFRILYSRGNNFYITMHTIYGLILLLSFIAIYDAVDTLRVYFYSKRKLSRYYLVCIASGMVSDVARVLFFIDPYSTLGAITYLYQISFFSLSASLHIISSSASLKVWYDTMTSIESGLKFRAIKLSRGVTYLGRAFMFTLWFIILIVDLLSNIFYALDVYNILSYNILEAPSWYAIRCILVLSLVLSELAIAISIITTRRKMISMNQIKPSSRSSLGMKGGGSSNNSIMPSSSSPSGGGGGSGRHGSGSSPPSSKKREVSGNWKLVPESPPLKETDEEEKSISNIDSASKPDSKLNSKVEDDKKGSKGVTTSTIHKIAPVIPLPEEEVKSCKPNFIRKISLQDVNDEIRKLTGSFIGKSGTGTVNQMSARLASISFYLLISAFTMLLILPFSYCLQNTTDSLNEENPICFFGFDPNDLVVNQYVVYIIHTCFPHILFQLSSILEIRSVKNIILTKEMVEEARKKREEKKLLKEKKMKEIQKEKEREMVKQQVKKNVTEETDRIKSAANVANDQLKEIMKSKKRDNNIITSGALKNIDENTSTMK